MLKQKQIRKTRPISFRSPKVTTEQLAELIEIDGDNVSRIIIRAIGYYYNWRVAVTKNREQA